MDLKMEKVILIVILDEYLVLYLMGRNINDERVDPMVLHRVMFLLN